METLKRSVYKDFSEGLAGDSEPETARMEIHLPQPLLDAVDHHAETSDEYSSRSELVREQLRQVVDDAE